MLARQILTAILIFGICMLSHANPAKPILSLVIDDLGYSYKYGSQSLLLPGRHTYAIIPKTIYANQLIELAKNQDQEIIMHMPMQATSNKVGHEHGTLTEWMDEDELITTTQAFLQSMPDIAGVNNHMGSHLTQYGYVMRPVMETIYQHNPSLYFLDSRTSANSMAYVEARRSGLKASKRNIFLDHDESEDEITRQFMRWLKRADEGQPAVAIAHPVKSTLSVIQPLLEKYQDQYQFLPLSEYLDQYQPKEIPTWHTYLSQWHQDAKTWKPSP